MSDILMFCFAIVITAAVIGLHYVVVIFLDASKHYVQQARQALHKHMQDASAQQKRD